MPIKYGELTIIFNKEEITLFTTVALWMKYDVTPPKNSKFIFLFDDGEDIRDSHTVFTDFNFHFWFGNSSVMPLFFTKDIKTPDIKPNTYFYKTPIKNIETNNLSLNFTNLFSSFSKYSIDTRIASKYNSIYYHQDESQEIFGILRIKSNEHLQRFQFAYDSNEFTKDDVICLIHKLFKV